MELTDACLKAFWLWYLEPEQLKTYKTESLMKYSTSNGNNIKIMFLADAFSQRYGVYEDFFDAQNIYIEIKFDTEDGIIFSWGYCMIGGTGYGFEFKDNFKTRHEARLAAIEKACEIYNTKKTGA